MPTTRETVQARRLADLSAALEAIATYAFPVYTVVLRPHDEPQAAPVRVVEFATADYLRTLATQALTGTPD